MICGKNPAKDPEANALKDAKWPLQLRQRKRSRDRAPAKRTLAREQEGAPTKEALVREQDAPEEGYSR